MLYGDDLDTLVEKANAIAKVATGIHGTQDTRVDRVGGQQYLMIDIDRDAIARYGLNAGDVNDVIETAIAGKPATEIYEGERRFSGVVRLHPICETASMIFATCKSVRRMGHVCP
jgi:cobalt-zinc-cadmium resistance protein CzcA